MISCPTHTVSVPTADVETGFQPQIRGSLPLGSILNGPSTVVRAPCVPAALWGEGVLTWLAASGGMGEGDLDWKASWDMKPESWEETLDSLTGACWARLELRYR